MNHLYDVQMTWWTHAIGAWKMGLKLFLLSLTALVHGMFPSIFTSKVSSEIHKLNEELS